MSSLILFLIFIILFLTLLFQNSFYRVVRLYIFARKVPGPPGWPLIGNALDFLGNRTRMFAKLLKYFESYPELGKFWLGTMLFYFASKPEYLEIILNHPGALEKSDIYKFLKDGGGNGLLIAPVSIWKKHRKLIVPTMKQRVLNQFLEPINRHADLFTETLSGHCNQENIDIFSLVSKCTFNISCELHELYNSPDIVNVIKSRRLRWAGHVARMEENRTAYKILIETIFGYKNFERFNEKDTGDLIHRHMDIMLLRTLKIWYRSDFLFRFTPKYKEHVAIINDVDNITGIMIQAKRLEVLNDLDLENRVDNLKRPLLESLVLLNCLNPESFSGKDVRDQSNIFFVGGSDTISTSFSYTLLLLGMYPEEQDKVYREILEVLSSKYHLELEDLPHLVYTERVIKESLRIFPSAPFLARTVTEDIDLGGVVLAKGAEVCCGLLNVHRNERYWPRPLEFDPDRFLPESNAKRHPYCYIPFSGGPRNCVGNKMAMMILKIILVYSIRKFKFSTGYKRVEDVEFQIGFVLKPKDGFKLSLQSR